MVAPPPETDVDPDDADVEDSPWDAAPERRSCEVPQAMRGQRLDKVLVTMAPEFSRSHLQGLIEQGHVQVDGWRATTASRKVLSGQFIEVELVPTAQSRAFHPERIALSIVYEDADLLVIDKAAGMVVHPAAGNWSGTALNALLAHHPGAARLPRAGIVHRLDKDTSGLMVVGKTLAAVTALSRALAAREVHREYLAIVHGQVPAAAFSIEQPIARDPRSRIRMAVLAGGKPARTDVQRVAQAAGCCALRCTLHTGRTHQIRVHLAAQGNPLVGDSLYGGRAMLGLQRQALHAARLSFAHPGNSKALEFTAEPPDDFIRAWKAVAEPE